MKIGLITRYLDLPVGYGTYARNLIEALGRAEGEHEYYVYTPRKPKFALPRGFRLRFANVPERRSKLTRWEHWDAPRAANRDRVDLIHYLSLSGPLPLTRRPVITSALDAINWAEPGYRLPRHYDLLARRDIRMASHLITISHAAKIDLNQYLGVPLDMISVTQLAPAPPDTRKTGRSKKVTSFLAGGPFFLFVGGTERRKNLSEVLEAYAEGSFKERLAVVGPTKASPIHEDANTLLEILEPRDRRKVRLLGRVSDADLDRLYRRARALIFPSRYEGFGLPALEAAIRKTPVITSNVSSLPEVVGVGAIQVPPDDAGALADAMRKISKDAKLRKRLVAKGEKNAKRFSWDRTARETLKVYERLGPLEPK